MKRGFGWFFVVGLSVSLMACGSEDASEPTNTSDPTDASDASDADDGIDPSTAEQTREQLILTLTGDAENGVTLYASNCQACHGYDGSGGSAGTSLQGMNFTEDLITSVLDGKNYMPAFGSFLTDQDIADLIAHVESL